MRIAIDPGHSGACEPGACAEGVTEAEVVLAIAEKLSRLLLAAGHSIMMTRSGDCPLTGLKWRAQLANCWRADLFLSIHANSYSEPTAHGSEVYYFPGSRYGLTLARLIQAEIVGRLGTTDRGSKHAMYTVLQETSCPAVLIETAFLSNPDERKLLTAPDSQRLFAEAIAAAVARYPQESRISLVD
jgi:N-acetylmuramoyl-L-alanine amidase